MMAIKAMVPANTPGDASTILARVFLPFPFSPLASPAGTRTAPIRPDRYIRSSSSRVSHAATSTATASIAPKE